jgi:type II secretory pathway pseudopilin PulG
MAALLVAMSVMAIMMSAALPAWQTAARREKEAELIFRGEQYARAIAMFQRKYGNSNPPNLDVLLQERFLRKKYKDPITGGDFVLIDPTTELAGRALPPGLQERGNTAASQRSGGGPGSARSGGARSGGSARSGQSSTSRTGRAGTSQGSRATASRSGTGRGGMQAGATGGIMGVMSKSTEKSFRLYNGSEYYNEWIFMATQVSNRAGAPSGGQPPGADGGARGRGAGTQGRGVTTQRGGTGRSTGSPSRGGRGR